MRGKRSAEFGLGNWPPARESTGSWLRRHSAFVGAVGVIAVATLSIFSLVVAESRLRSLDGDNDNDRATAATTPAPAPAARATTSPSGPPGPPGLATGVFDATNTDRADAGIGALRWNSDLAGSAQLWADTMADRITLGYQDLSGVLELGFQSAAENVLVGPADIGADAAQAGWMNSATHRRSILSNAYTDVGIGVATSFDGRVWVAVTFAG